MQESDAQRCTRICKEVRNFIGGLPLSDADKEIVERLAARTGKFLLDRLRPLKKARVLDNPRAVHDGVIATMMKMSTSAGPAAANSAESDSTAVIRRAIGRK